MFLDLLTPEQQALFVDCTATLTEADGELHAAESELLDQIARETGHDPGQPSARPLGELAERAKLLLADDPAAARVFLLELSGVVVIDGEHTPEEQALLERFSEATGVPRGDISAFIAFAERARDLVADGRSLVAATNTGG